MIRKLARALMFLSIPLLFLFFFRIEDYLMNKAQNDKKRSIDTTNEILIQTNSSKPIHHEYSKWNVLIDGSVVHEGNQHYDRNYNLTVNNPNICKDIRKDNLSFLFVIETDILNFERRDFVRTTWGLKLFQTLGNFRVIFLVGLRNDSHLQNKLEYENSMYGDIVQIEVDEHFSNLTYKSINMLKWYIEYCSEADFLVKTDDDIYIHIPNIIQLFTKLKSNNKNGLVCHKNKSRRILRNVDESHKYIPTSQNISIDKIQNKFSKYILKKEIPGELYPEYCSGFIYTMNAKIAKRLFEYSKTIPMVSIEDVFITGLVRQKANIMIEDNVHLRLNPIIFPIESKCIFDEGRITSNEMTLNDLNSLWLHVNTNGFYCKYSRKVIRKTK